MKKRIALLIALAGLLLAGGGAPEPCPIDGSTSLWTGETRIDQTTARILYQYRCARLPGHVFWAAD